MTDEEILKYIQTYIRVRRKRKEKRKTEPILPTSPQQIISRNSILPTITPKPPLPVIPPAPGMSSQTKQDIPEVSNLLNELRLYKESDLKRKHENAKLQLEKLQLQNDIAAERLEKARLEEEKTYCTRSCRCKKRQRQKMKEYEKALENLRKAENDAAKKQQELDNIINQLNETKQELEALGIKILDLGHQKSDLEIEKNKILDQLYKVNKEIINHRKRIVSDLERKINEARIDIIVNAMKKYRYQSDNGKSDDKRSPSPGINSVRKLLKELSKLEDLDYEHRKRLEDLRKHKSFRQIAIELDKLKDNENDPYWAYIIHPEEVENDPDLRGLKHRLENAKNSLKQFEEQLPPEDDYYLEQLFEPGYTEVNPQEVEPEDKALEEKLKQIEQISFEEPYIPQFQQSNEQQSDQNLSGTGIHWGGQDNRLKYLMRQRQLLLNKLHELRGIGKRKVDKDNDNDNGLWTNQINSIMQKVPNF